jgi:tetratricopeptide (TPR) repeat protein
MGVVYVVQDPTLGRPVVAKTFRDDVLAGHGGGAVVERFHREATVWIGIGTHPNIVQAHRVRSIDGKPYLVLEYVPGGTLTKLISSNQLVENRVRTLNLALDCCRGMHFAHTHGIEAHRDLKPDNCLLTNQGQLKVTDFGLVKVVEVAEIGAQQATPSTPKRRGLTNLLGRLLRRGSQQDAERRGAIQHRITQAGTAAGTPLYMAPEQFEDVASVDSRTDVYAFGVMFYEMITGRVPFNGDSLATIYRQHRIAVPASIPGASKLLWTGLLKCLAKTPQQRFANFDEVATWIGELIEEETGKKASPLEPTRGGAGADALSRGYVYANLGRFQEALFHCDNALAAESADYEAWVLRGRVLSVLGRSLEALEAHDRSLQLNPDSGEAWHARGMTLSASDRWEEALECYERALKLDQHDAKTWYDKGVALQRLGRIQEAGHSWDRSLQLDPENELAWCNRGAVWGAEGDKEAALACYKRALSLNPRDEKALYNLGALLAEGFQRPIEGRECFAMAEALGMTEATAAREHCERLIRKALSQRS